MRDRTLGVLAIGAAAVLMLWFTLVPVKLSVLGTDVSCGPPAVRWIAGNPASVSADKFERALGEQCVTESMPRVVFGAATAAIGAAVGSVLLRPRRQY